MATSDRPLAIDLYTGLHGWALPLSKEGWRVVGFDIVDMHAQLGHPRTREVELVLQDVRTLHGAQLRNADLIVASPPCQQFSYRAMPWKKAKALGPPIKGTELFWQCWRIQHEASEAAGRYIPLIVENVRGAQPWVGEARWHYGSFYLWGDVPPLMPISFGQKNTGGSWFGQRDRLALERNDPRDVRNNEAGEWENAEARGGWNHPGKALDGRKNEGGSWFNIGSPGQKVTNRNPVHDGTKQHGSGPAWFETGIAKLGSRSSARKAASAQIAKIPWPLAQHIARVFKPQRIIKASA